MSGSEYDPHILVRASDVHVYTQRHADPFRQGEVLALPTSHAKLLREAGVTLHDHDAAPPESA